MNTTISISAALNNNANYFVVTAYSDPQRTIIAETQIPIKGGSIPYYADPFQVVFTTLTANKMYYFVLWENTTQTPGGTARNSVNFQPTADLITLRADLYLTADVTPGFASGGASYVDASLVGWSYRLIQIGFGPLKIGRDYTQDIGGGWTLLNGQTIQNNQDFNIEFQPQISQGIAAQPSLISASVLLTANTTIDNTYKNKAILLQGAAASFVVNLAALSTVSDFDVFYFYSCGGSHKNVSIRCQGTDKIQRNAQVTKIVLGQNEMLKLFRVTVSGTPYYFVDNELFGVDNVGLLIESHSLTEINTVPFDGSLLSRTTYERLWDKIQTFGAGILIADANWAHTDGNGNFDNKGFFSTGDGSTTFRVPDLRLYPTRRVVDGSTRIAGSFELQQILVHTHGLNGANGVVGIPNPNNGYTGGGSGGGGGQIKVTDSTGGNELRTNDTGIYLLCRI